MSKKGGVVGVSDHGGWAVLAFLAICALFPVVARADCTAHVSQEMVQKAYAYLNDQQWDAARVESGLILKYVQASQCQDAWVQTPAFVHATYVGASALHELGKDDNAKAILGFGMHVLDTYHQEIAIGMHMVVPDEAGYKAMFENLYGKMWPKFQTLAGQLH